MDKLGWSEPVSTMMRLQTALRILSHGKGKFGDRMADATGALVGLTPEDFPERLRGRATKVLRARSEVAERHRTGTLFKFGCLTRKKRRALTEDILALYEACLIDLGKMGEDYDFVYPKDR
jgi:hypothetical protein